MSTISPQSLSPHSEIKTIAKDPPKIKYGTFYPEIHQYKWLNFCTQHLTNETQLCNDCNNYLLGYQPKEFETKQLYPTEHFEALRPVNFLSRRFKPYNISIEQIKELYEKSHLIPINERICAIRQCNLCSEELKYFDYVHDDIDYPGNEKCPKCNALFEKTLTCQNAAIPSLYFEAESSKLFFEFLLEHLRYCEENPRCLCYWPHKNESSCEISDHIFNSMLSNTDKKADEIKETSQWGTQSYFKYNSACDQVPYFRYEIVSPDIWYGKAELFRQKDLITRFLSNTFFYSQYKYVLSAISELKIPNDEDLELVIYREYDWFEDFTAEEQEETRAKLKKNLKNVFSDLKNLRQILTACTSRFIELYSKCLETHPHSKIYHELGLVYFDIQEYEKAFDCFEKGLELDPNNETLKNALEGLAEENKSSDWLLKVMLLKQNLNAWTGLSFSKKAMSIQFLLAKGGCRSLWSFTKESAVGAWSMLSSIYDLVFAPPEVKVEKVIELIEVTKSIKNVFSKDGLTLILDSCAKRVDKWKTLPFNGKIEALGFALGSATLVSIEAAGAVKSLASLKKLTQLGKVGRASNITRLQAEEIAIQVNNYLKRVEAYKKTTKLHTAKQALHDASIANRNASGVKSIVHLTHNEIEILTHPLMGTGIPIKGHGFGYPDFKEIVKFGKACGETYIDKLERWVETPYAKIHYRQDGSYHIVPYRSDGELVKLWGAINEQN